MQYFLKAKFDFGKDEYAVIVIFEAAASVFGRVKQFTLPTAG